MLSLQQGNFHAKHMRTDDDDDDDVCDMGKGKIQFLLKFYSECQVVLAIGRETIESRA